LRQEISKARTLRTVSFRYTGSMTMSLETCAQVDDEARGLAPPAGFEPATINLSPGSPRTLMLSTNINR